MSRSAQGKHTAMATPRARRQFRPARYVAATVLRSISPAKNASAIKAQYFTNNSVYLCRQDLLQMISAW